MEDDDLEYDITFPSPVPAEDAGEIQANLNDRKEPVVIILGWMGCREKHLAKYGQIYDDRGCITIRYTSPRDVVFFKPEKLHDIACKILDLLRDYSIEENPILFHIFSNNGSHLYSSIVDVLTSGDERFKCLNVCGIIVDSAPGKARYSKAAKAYASSLHVNPILKYIMVLGMLLFITVRGFSAIIISMFYPEYRKHSNYYLFERMAEDPTRWPMLFLYSASDKVIMSCDIEDMISKRKKLGIHVDAVRWEDTDHVSHLRKYPEQYVEACENFLCFCLGIERAEITEFTEEDTFETEEDYLLSKKE